MRKRFAILFGLLCLALFDSLMAYNFPIDFQFQHFSTVFHAFFIGTIVFSSDKPWLTRLLIGAACGIMSDLFFTNSFPVNTLLFALFAWAAGAPKRLITRPKYAFLINMICCFFFDLIPYLFLWGSGSLHLSFLRWLYCLETVTTVMNALLIVTIMYLDLVLVRFFQIQKHEQERQAERRKRNLALLRQKRAQASSH